jgi:ribonuclease G
MSKELIVSVNGREKKIAIIEDDVVTEFYVERGDENQGIVGNIYKGRVMKVLPGMQSAFVDIGLERDSFLYVSDFFDEEELDEDEAVPQPQPRAAILAPAPAPAPTPYRDRQRQTREAREAAYEVARIAVDDREAELAAAAIQHIEDIAEEPEIEPAPGDEMLTAGLGTLITTGSITAYDGDEEEPVAEARPRDGRQRRRNRLRYTEPEEVVEAPVIPAAEAPEAEAEAEAPEEAAVPEDLQGDEAQGEDSQGRRRRRRRRRGSGAETAEVESPEAMETFELESVAVADLADEEAKEAAAEEAAAPAKYEPVVIVHHNPFERILDDEADAGELLKDAIMQERIAEQVRAEEFRTTMLEVEPTPDVKVGSLTGALGLPAGFERISDDEEVEAVQPVALAEAPAEEANEEAAEEQLANPVEALVEKPVEALVAVNEPDQTDAAAMPAEAASDTDSAWAETPRQTRDLRTESVPDTAALPTPEEDVLSAVTDELPVPLPEIGVVELLGDVEVLSLNPTPPAAEPMPEGSAKVRQRARRGEMAATRRGGRGRRRNFPTRRAVTEATADTEEYHEDDHVEAAPLPVAAPAPIAAPAYSRSSSSSSSSTINQGGSRVGHDNRFHRPVITDLLREGQEIIVQIAKEPIGQKGARITSHVALPGRYIVYMPTVEHIGVSRKIGTDEERMRLKRTLHTLRAETGATGGFIVRTAAHGCTTEELRDDMQYLVRTWNDMRRRADRVKAPAIIHRDLDLVQRILRDQLSGDFSAIRVDNEIEYERMVDFVNRFAPKMVNRVKLYTKDEPILDHYGVQAEIDKAVKPRVWLKSGGYIVINQTEALVAIDVNTGKFVGKSNRLEDTITKTNLEAAKEIVRQIRLRDLGGIIVLDFIDMEERRNRQKVLQALEYEMRADKAPSKILQFNDFGLVAVTRKRVKQSLERTLCTPCSYCGGGGMVKSPQTVAYEILAEARSISKDVDDANEVILRVHPDVAKALRSSERDVLQEIEAYLGGVVSIKSDPAVHQEQFDIALS